LVPDDYLPATQSAGIAWCSAPAGGSAALGTSGACPANIGEVTGVRMVGSTITAGQKSVFRMTLDESGNKGGNVYTNRFKGSASGLSLPVESNNVSAIVLVGRVGNLVWNDLNGDGKQQSNEPGVAGVSVTLTGKDKRSVVPTASAALTNTTGDYQFGDLISTGTNSYEITFDKTTLPSGYVFTEKTVATVNKFEDSNADTTTGKTGAIALTPGQNDQSWDAGIVRPATIDGYVYVDALNDGLKALTDAGLAGITIRLTGTDGRNNMVTLETTTDADGHYIFGNLWPGSYTVEEVQTTVDTMFPNTYNDGKTTTGTLGQGAGIDLVVPGTVLPANPNKITAINLTQDVDSLNNNFGEPFKPASLAGNVFVDANDNGLADESVAAPIANVTVTLTGTDILGNPVTKTTTTDGTGAYKFEGLLPGTYTVTETQPSDYVDGKDSVGTISGVAVGSLGGTAPTVDQVKSVVLGAAEDSVQNNFAELTPAKLSGKVVTDATGAPVAGVQITLTGKDDRGVDVTYTTYTAADGTYSFTGLRPGTYNVVETQPAGYIDGAAPVTPGSTGGTAGANRISSVTLVQGDNSVNNNFAETNVAGLSGKVYHDKNNDGIFDPTDQGIQGALSTLTGTDDQGNPVTRTTTTGADGSYSFTSLRPGTYVVTEAQPAGYVDGKDTAGTVAGAAVGATTNDKHAAIVLGADQSGIEYNFGEIKTASLAGNTYVDDNKDGVKSTGDTPLANVPVTLTGTDINGKSVNITVYTDANGFYEFTGLVPGVYQVTEVQPVAYVDGPENPGSNGGTATTNTISAITINSSDTAVNYDLGEVPTADLAVSKKASGTPTVGGDIVYEIELSNAGPSTATNITVLDTWPAGLSYVSHTAAVGTYNNSNKLWSIPTLAAGASTKLFITARLVSMVSVVNGVQVQSADQVDIDSTPGNDTVPTSRSEDDDAFVALPAPIPATISGKVWVDLNNDGIIDGSEAPIAGVAVTLTGVDGAGNPITPIITYTSADGTYSFSGLAAGTYTVTEAQPASYLDGKDAAGSGSEQNGVAAGDKVTGIKVAAGESNINNNFGELPRSSIGGHVYVDKNNNGGGQGAGEPGIGGVEVKLTGTDSNNNPVTVTTTTDNNGNYRFPDLAPGTYVVTEVQQPAAYLDGKDSAGSINGTTVGSAGADVVTAIVLPAGVDSINNDFGEIELATIAGVVKDVSPGSPTPLGGVTIKLTGTDDLGQPVTLETTTAADGSYSFPGLRPGLYALQEVQPSGLFDKAVRAGTNGGTATGNTVTAVNLLAGQTAAGNDFDEIKPAKITGTVIAEATGLPIVAVVVKLTGTDDLGQPVTWETKTDVNGMYTFADLRPGIYTVTEVQPATWLDGNNPSTPGTTGGTETGTNVLSAITLAAGDDSKNNDFAELKPSSITGRVSNDFTNAPIGNVEIILTGTDDLGQPVRLVITSNADGTYQFNGLRPGTYAVTETQPAGWLDKSNPLGNSGGTADDFNTTKGIVLSNTGTDVTGVDFTEIKPSAISGVVYVDKNNDGIQGSDEPGIPGVTMTISGNDDLGQPVTKEIVTGPNGEYSFTDLRPGNYNVTETEPLAYVDGKETPGTTAGPTAPKSTTNDVISVSLNPEAHSTVNNFGERPLSVISGSVALAKMDGSKSDKPIAGVLITLTGTDDKGQTVTRTTTTDANGNYKFADLRPGTYKVTETQPEGWIDSKSFAGSNGGLTATNETAEIVLGINDAATGYDFTETKSVSVKGVVHADADNDGKVATGTGIMGVTVTLTGTDDLGNPVSKTATTDSTGSYTFADLRPGTYTLTETTPAGYVDGKDAAGNPVGAAKPVSPSSDIITLVLDPSTDENVLQPAPLVSDENNFGEIQRSSMSGKVWNEGLANKPGIAGVKIILVGTDLFGNPVRLETVTDADGKYTFQNVVPGTYKLMEEQPTGFDDDSVMPGTSGGTASGMNEIGSINLKPGTHSNDNNFSEHSSAKPLAYPTIVTPGVIEITNSTPTTTSVAPVVSPTTTVPLVETATPSAPAPVVSAAPTTIPVVVQSAPADQSLVKGLVFLDINKNGVIDPKEKGVRGIIVRLTGTDGKEFVITSSEKGTFSIANVPAGTYQLDIVGGLKPGFKLTTNTKVIVIGTSGEVVERNVGLPSSTSVEGILANSDLELALSLTGSRSVDLSMLALGLMTIGALLVLASRRRRRPSSAN
jgi:uncharacterized repeat protein (TIGR01451 family)